MPVANVWFINSFQLMVLLNWGFSETIMRMIFESRISPSPTKARERGWDYINSNGTFCKISSEMWGFPFTCISGKVIPAAFLICWSGLPFSLWSHRELCTPFPRWRRRESKRTMWGDRPKFRVWTTGVELGVSHNRLSFWDVLSVSSS